MKFRKIKLIAIGIITLFFSVLSWYLIDRFSYANEQSYYQENEANQDTVLTVGIIGDSWVAGQKLDSLLHQELLKNELSNRIISSGHPGAKSKLIYENLFKSNDIEYELSWTISPDFRGKGIGKIMVKILADRLQAKIRAEIKKGNIASVRIAEYAGMTFKKEENQVLHYSNY